jgi:hypothetical protein
VQLKCMVLMVCWVSLRSAPYVCCSTLPPKWYCQFGIAPNSSVASIAAVYICCRPYSFHFWKLRSCWHSCYAGYTDSSQMLLCKVVPCFFSLACDLFQKGPQSR